MIEKLLAMLPPETAHSIAKCGMKHRLRAPGPHIVFDHCGYDRPTYNLFGTPINNPLGLAAGFDKNGELIDVIQDYGFGFVEVGSVTFRGGPGNPKPRLFRLSELYDDHAILNRMGLNGDPAEVVADRLKKAKSKAFAVNIAKTHSPDIMGDAAIRDIVGSYKLLRNFGAYTCLNISCPNTREGKTFETPGALKELLNEIGHYRDSASSTPLLVKLSPTLVTGDHELFEKLIATCQEFEIGGYICCNTLPLTHPIHGKGGLSGKSVKSRAITLIKWLRQDEKVTKPIIACGGIYTGRDLLDYKEAGANFFQAYTGFVRGPNAGPAFAHRVLQDYDFLTRPSID